MFAGLDEGTARPLATIPRVLPDLDVLLERVRSAVQTMDVRAY